MNAENLPKGQRVALQFFRQLLEQERDAKGPYPREIVRFEPEPLGSTDIIMVRAELEITSLPEDNLLRFVDQQSWYVAITPRGRIDVHICPKCFKQFAGRRAFRMNFRKDVVA